MFSVKDHLPLLLQGKSSHMVLCSNKTLLIKKKKTADGLDLAHEL